MDTARHRDRIAIVTGAASGIGRATVLRLAGEGATVVGIDVDADAVAAMQDDVRDDPAIHMDTADITDQADVDRIVDETLSRHGRIDILANVAGIMDWMLPAHEVDDGTWERVMAVNVTGPFKLCRAVLPSMRAEGGAIVNVGSAAGSRGGAAGAAYTTSKHAVVGLTRSIAWVYAPDNVRCNIVMPGGVETNIGTTAAPRSEFGIGRLTPIHGTALRMAKSDEIATAVSWLASDEASNINGAVIAADGGWGAG